MPCQHGRQSKSRCSECLGHPVNQNKCSRCKKNFITEDNLKTCHDCRKTKCCHGLKNKSDCKECDKLAREKQKCQHDKRKNRCKICSPNSVCSHSILKENCRTCNPDLTCVHNAKKSNCVECSGINCEHNKRRSLCIMCTPSIGCKNCKLNIRSQYKTYRPYCFQCYCVLNPEIEIPRRFKLRENHLADALSGYGFIQDKRIEGGCSARRPDFLLECFTHVVIVECDENGHSGYDTNCEISRINETFTDLGDRPIVLIRFNPDVCKESGKRCFDKDGKLIKTEWTKRVKQLKLVVDESINNIPTKLLTEIHLFY